MCVSLVRAALAASLAAAAVSTARAQSVRYSSSVAPTFITHSGAGGSSTVYLDTATAPSPPMEVSDPGAFVSLMNYTLSSNANASVSFDDTFVYDFQLTEEGSGQSTDLKLTGKVTGSLNQFQSNITISFETGAGVSLVLNGQIYTLGQFQITSASPNFPGAIYARLMRVAGGTRGTAAAPVKASPTAVDGVVYFAANDGKVYATNAATGAPVPGFPTDGAIPGNLLSRVAVYARQGGKSAYLTSDSGYVTKVNANGGIAWSKQPLGASSVTVNASTPAVTPAGEVIVGLTNDAGSFVVKLNDATGDTIATSPPLGGPGSAISAPAVDDMNNVYVGLTGGTSGDIVLLQQANLTPRAGGGFAVGEGVTAPPYVLNRNMFVGTLAGNFYKVNSVTLETDPLFGVGNGGPGKAAIGEPLPTSAFPNTGDPLAGGIFYMGTTMGKVFGVNALDGAKTLFFDTGDPAAKVGGIVINRATGVLAFGTSAGTFYQVPLASPGAYTSLESLGPITTTPTLDRASNSLLFGSDDNHVYAVHAE